MDQKKIRDVVLGMDKPNGNMRIVDYSDLETKPVRWLLRPYIPYGKVTIISGDPGTGKSTFALNLAARLTSGSGFPLSEGLTEARDVLYLTTEDDHEDTVLPRFLKAGGDSGRLHTIDESLFPICDFSDDRIAEAIRATNSKLLIIDPLASYVGEKTNVNLGNQMRYQTNHLISIAKDLDIAVIIIAHLNKSMNSKALYKTAGSVDILAAARSGLLVVEYSKKEPRLRAAVHIKSNLAEKGKAIIFEVCGNGELKFLRFEDVDVEALINPSLDKTEKRKQYDEAREIIENCLEENDGEVSSNEIFDRLKDIDLSIRSIKKLKKEMGINSVKRQGQWFWRDER